MDSKQALELEINLGKVFSPSAPIDSLSLFAGRRDQRNAVTDAVLQKGRHAILFGERGVGKTSLASIIQSSLEQVGESVVAVRVNCDETDDFSSVWRKVLNNLQYVVEERKVGFGNEATTSIKTLADGLGERVTPEDVRQMLTYAGQGCILLVVLDEFDRLPTPLDQAFSDTIKSLSDHATDATVLLVGVAESVEQLIENHQSVERALAQIRVPRMANRELAEIIDLGLKEVGMTAAEPVRNRIVALSRGLPHYTHLVSLDAARHAVECRRLEICDEDVDAGIAKAVDNAQETIKATHHRAVMSPRGDNLYRQVALACAMADVDERGYFAAVDVRAPMSKIMSKQYDIPQFARHLSHFCDDRGPLLNRIGSERNYRYIFINPLIQPYIVMDGIARGLVKSSAVSS